MNKTTIAFLIIFSFSFRVNSEALPSFTLPIYSKKETFDLQVESKKYNKVLINFWASWCGACIRELQELEDLKKKYSKKGVLFIAINAGEKKKKIKRFIRKYKFSYLILEDENRETSKMLKVTELPRTILIDSKMNIIFSAGHPPTKIEP